MKGYISASCDVDKGEAVLWPSDGGIDCRYDRPGVHAHKPEIGSDRETASADESLPQQSYLSFESTPKCRARGCSDVSRGDAGIGNNHSRVLGLKY